MAHSWRGLPELLVAGRALPGRIFPNFVLLIVILHPPSMSNIQLGNMLPGRRIRLALHDTLLGWRVRALGMGWDGMDGESRVRGTLRDSCGLRDSCMDMGGVDSDTNSNLDPVLGAMIPSGIDASHFEITQHFPHQSHHTP